MGLLDKVKQQVTGYKDAETGKTGFGGVASEGQAAFKAYQDDAKDGTVDWKKQGTNLFGEVKEGLGGGSKPAEAVKPAEGAAPAEAVKPAEGAPPA